MPRKVTSISITDKEIQDRIKATGCGNFTKGVAVIAKIYYCIMANNMPKFTESETKILIKTLKGIELTEGNCLEPVFLIKDRIVRRFELEMINTDSEVLGDIITKVQRLSAIEAISLIETINKYDDNLPIRAWFNIG